MKAKKQGGGLRSEEFQILEASRYEVQARFRDIHLIFRRSGKRIHLISKTNSRRIYDPQSFWIDRQDFKHICRTVAKVMDDKSVLKQSV